MRAISDIGVLYRAAMISSFGFHFLGLIDGFTLLACLCLCFSGERLYILCNYAYAIIHLSRGLCDADLIRCSLF